MKKFSAIFLAMMLIFIMAACKKDGAVAEKSPTNPPENSEQAVSPTKLPESSGQAVDPTNPPESSGQAVEPTNPETKEEESGRENAREATTDELFDLFINGSISAVSSKDPTSAFYITDLNMDSEGWGAYSIGEREDLDNDGENELVINGPYGGIYLDARDNKVYEFAAGDGNALVLSYTVYNGAVWIMYSNCMNAGYESYHMEKFEGADNLVGEINFGEELADGNNLEAGMKYTWNGAEISYEEYFEFCSKIFAAQVTQALPSGTNTYANLYISEITGRSDSMVFSLVFLDEDDIPELFACDLGSSVFSIYTVKGDSIHCLADSMNAAELTYFERSSIIAAFARWNGGGDEGGYGRSYYQVSDGTTLTDNSCPVLSDSYNATYDENGAYAGTGITQYYHGGKETDEASYREQMGILGIEENNEKSFLENAHGKEEMLHLLGQ